ncbi:uncharacterized protein LOC131681918 [Topomyia yanbarensis]|uniref:uncharacterized protein LOC131681918 n=1 Tax=Topomyia yanbarensis TaxID=2498891 RepID=UPI00273C67F9|nr:uncharacterized protein LOC131681918 [Topomyia yanbarensis]
MKLQLITMDKSRLSTCFYLCLAMLLNSSQGHPTPSQQLKVNGNNMLPQVKKDVFMSRGWGASGMPFTMFYLNHYTKAQKAYAQNQQQQLQKLRQQEDDENKLRPGEDQISLDQPRILPHGTRYADPLANAHHSEYGRNGPKDDEYTDSSAYLPAKSSSPRRHYNVPQLFVSYGWGPMG